jgi:hypothetical protein
MTARAVEWVDISVDARAYRRAVFEGRKQRHEVPRWAFWTTPEPGTDACPDCGHGRHQPYGALAGKVCGFDGCYCRRINDVCGRPHGRRR